MTEGVNILFRNTQLAYLHDIHTPQLEMFPKSSTEGVWWIQMELLNLSSLLNTFLSIYSLR